MRRPSAGLRPLAPLLWTLALAACSGPPKFDQSIIKNLRIIGIKAEPPELSPGQVSTLTALVVSPSAETPLLIWAMCPSTQVSGVGCFTANQLERLGVGETVTSPIPTGAPIGADLLVGLIATAAVDHDIGFKRIRVQGTDLPNHNPSIAQVKANGSPCAPTCEVYATATVTLEMDAAPGSAETYTDIEGAKTETLVTSWFSTGGDFKYERSMGTTSQTEWTPPATAPAGTPYPLWLVLRDNRGGEDWIAASLKIYPTGPNLNQ